jgi:predicted DNA-binding transcriptional regulator YafY
VRTADVNGIERAALLTQRLLEGRALSARDAAELCEVSVWTARRDLNTMSRVLAIYRDDRSGLWRVLRSGEEADTD